MLEILQFIFSDFWHFIGTLALICFPLIIIENAISVTIYRLREPHKKKDKELND